ncbi:metal ABC transporter permease [Coprobacter tertius]|uniref:Metal ABC transporter permease n=1 Tax=Coprobacter tertius TaxID=2944915 RepID=A0ABT1MG34_9BACT|nr:metal ABC transporter permease [Coprobacter tertius]MCP9611585.1 metal ABC transporter permease [Coprobacter tertius]
MDILRYTFFQNALLAVLLVGVAGAIIGTYIVTRRLVFITGGITHASFGGLGLGFFLGISPTVTALFFAVLSALGVEWLSKRNAVREDSAIAAFWALGMALGVIFIFLTPGYTPGLSEFLFGNILTITHYDIMLFGGYTLVLSLFFIIFYRPVMYVAFDRDFAFTRHIPVRLIEYSMMLMVSVCVVLTIRLVGIMLLMSLLTMPQIIADQFCSRYKNILYLSGILAIISGLSGLFISYYINVPAGACIVFVLVILYIVTKIFVWAKRYRLPV